MPVHTSHVKSPYLSVYSILPSSIFLTPDLTSFSTSLPKWLFWFSNAAHFSSFGSWRPPALIPLVQIFFIIQTPETPGLTEGSQQPWSGRAVFNWSHFTDSKTHKRNQNSNQEIQFLASLISLVTLLAWSTFSSPLKGGGETWILASVLYEFISSRRSDR